MHPINSAKMRHHMIHKFSILQGLKKVYFVLIQQSTTEEII